jgi:TRAP transporter 4TM/12TM fusion protein
VLSVPQRLGYLIFPEQILATILALATALVFIDTMETGSGDSGLTDSGNFSFRNRLTIAFAAISLIVGLYLAVRIPVLSEEAFFRPIETLVVSAIVIPLVIEALRRSVGWSLVIVFSLFAVYAIFGDLIPGKMQARASSPTDLLRFLGTDTTAMLGLPLSVTCLVVVMFIFFGRVLQTTGGTAFFTGLSQALAGSGPGSPARVSIVASSLFGSISGSAVSNVMSTGVITIPLMKRSGIPAYRAGAIESVASTGGQLMPPVMGAAAFLMAEFLQIPYKEILIAALIPAVLYYLALFLQVDFLARKSDRISSTAYNDRSIVHSTGQTGDSNRDIDNTIESNNHSSNRRDNNGSDNTPSVASVLKDGWLLPIPFAVLIVALFKFNLSPELSVFYSLLVLVILSFLRRDRQQWMTPRRVIEDLAATGQSVASLILVTAIAGMIIGVLSNTGLAFSLGFVLLGFGENSLFGLLLLTGLVCIILGMGLPTTGVYLLLATLAAPPLIDLGLEPIQAHLFVLYFGMLSMITPPVALAAFAAAGLADAPQMRTGFEAMRLGWCAYLVPFLFVYHPQLLFQGSTLSVITTLISVLAALLMISASLAGYVRTELSTPVRLFLPLVAVPLLLPLTGQLQWLQLIALCVALSLCVIHYLQTRLSN